MTTSSTTSPFFPNFPLTIPLIEIIKFPAPPSFPSSIILSTIHSKEIGDSLTLGGVIFFDLTADFIDQIGWFNRVLVSSNDEKVIEKAKSRKYEIIERSEELSGSTVSIKEVIKEVIVEKEIEKAASSFKDGDKVYNFAMSGQSTGTLLQWKNVEVPWFMGDDSKITTNSNGKVKVKINTVANDVIFTQKGAK